MREKLTTNAFATIKENAEFSLNLLSFAEQYKANKEKDGFISDLYIKDYKIIVQSKKSIGYKCLNQQEPVQADSIEDKLEKEKKIEEEIKEYAKKMREKQRQKAEKKYGKDIHERRRLMLESLNKKG